MSRFLLVVPLLLLVVLPIVSGSEPGSGTVIIHTKYGTLQGQLKEATLQGDNVTMSMIIDDLLSFATDIPFKATATWIGTRADQAVSGTVKNITGTLYGRAFTGQADWAGTLTSSLAGTGTLTGKISIMSGIPFHGTWTATFTPVKALSELQIGTLLIVVLSSLLSETLVKVKQRRHG